ncbi:MAG: protein-L-isoaspartate(D-aspartate) O-methyltransferase [Deltaproteobacteria bacterium]|nr:protein-L-isoaspartate(D-aspartate) O-methyltransferase [Deltaproteobacteria bacterium]MBW2307317.1 protein-L-isoaspartate(D-aspartate) O-methyltransferase [Deltaproteobacteria bacterium]
MLENQLISRGIKDQRVLNALRKIPRHLFVEEALHHQAYGDHPLPIGEKQTISQPYIVALMTEALELKGSEKVLEIGTGSGYQTAILAELADMVYSIERIPPLVYKARKTLDELGYFNINIRIGDGTKGWEEESPFDAIIVTAASPEVPRPLQEQLIVGGLMVVPVGGRYSQDLIKVERTEKGFVQQNLGGCRFVSLIGQHGWQE